MRRNPTKSVGIQSVEVSASLLRALADLSGPMTLTNLSKGARMSLSKAHKYLASFIRVGLVRQDNATGRYMLGRFAAEIGLAALRNIDIVDISQEKLELAPRPARYHRSAVRVGHARPHHRAKGA